MEPFAALLGTYWLPSDSDHHNDAVVGGCGTQWLASWNGRVVIVEIAAVTVILAVVSVVVRDLPA
ncbi:hypothetical protein CA983_11235 [Streptomyces swartbergensis]|uniref:Uncharacterized protein n=1 Tax=Streptomyces swartbergensis TaxID=487165 RepID=A0A243S6A9_9ACTN|nr:hypothetical protein CA983_11235 [Streptomyces swartbergensis]